MGMERGLIRLMRTAASGSSAPLARGPASWSPPMPEHAPAQSGGFLLVDPRESIAGKRRPVWQEWSRGYADSSVEKEDTLRGNVEYLEFGTHKTTGAKRYAVGKTATDVVEVRRGQVDDDTKEKAKAILQQVGEKIEETVEEAKRRQLLEKLAATEGVREVVHELYNQHEDHTKHPQAEGGVNA